MINFERIGRTSNSKDPLGEGKRPKSAIPPKHTTEVACLKRSHDALSAGHGTEGGLRSGKIWYQRTAPMNCRIARPAGPGQNDTCRRGCYFPCLLQKYDSPLIKRWSLALASSRIWRFFVILSYTVQCCEI